MPRQTRQPPRWLSRWNYWIYSIAYPMPVLPVELPPAADGSVSTDAMQDIVRTDFLAILNGETSPALLIQPEQLTAELLQLKAPALATETDPRIRALCYVILCDGLWHQNACVQNVLRTLPQQQRDALDALDRQRWPHSPRQTWATLLQTIAKDQEIFRSYMTHSLLPWKGYRLSGGDAHRIYNVYHQQTAVLLGHGFLLPKIWQGKPYPDEILPTQKRIPTEQLLATEEEVFHWFAHALRNLHEYRYGRPPRLWPSDPASCARACYKVQQHLLPPRHHR